jgi:hypothetical protein
MLDTNINFVDDTLKALLQAGTDFPNADMDFCVGYVTASGVLLLKKMVTTQVRWGLAKGRQTQ